MIVCPCEGPPTFRRTNCLHLQGRSSGNDQRHTTDQRNTLQQRRFNLFNYQAIRGFSTLTIITLKQIRHWMDGPGFESRQWQHIFLFSKSSGSALGPTQTPIQWGNGVHSRTNSRRSVKLAVQLKPTPRSAISGAIPLHSPYAFTAWAVTTLTKHKGKDVIIIRDAQINVFLIQSGKYIRLGKYSFFINRLGLYVSFHAERTVLHPIQRPYGCCCQHLRGNLRRSVAVDWAQSFHIMHTHLNHLFFCRQLKSPKIFFSNQVIRSPNVQSADRHKSFAYHCLSNTTLNLSKVWDQNLSQTLPRRNVIRDAV